MKMHRIVPGRPRRAVAAAGGSILLVVLMVGLLVVPASATVFSNPTLIAIPTGPGVATPYPSPVAVTGLVGSITDVNVTLTGVAHAFPDDVDVLLVGPSGQSVVLMSDTGGTLDIIAVNLTFDDAATGSLPDNAQIVTGTFKPTRGTVAGGGSLAPANYTAPAPAGPYGTTLAIFNGTSGNGAWNLFVLDDSAGDSGQIGTGWSLNITTTAPTITSFAPTSGTAGTLVVITGTNLTGATSVTFGGVAATAFVVNSATQITATVPAGAVTGPIAATTPVGTATSATSFTVSATAATITSFSPTSGPVGTSVVITGTNFTGATSVTFGGVAASTFTVNSATQITATVPTGAVTGPITVVTPGGNGTSATSFTVSGGDHSRSVTINLTPTKAKGTVSVDDGFSACASNVPVKVQFFQNRHWHTLDSTTTSGSGKYSVGGATADTKFRAVAKRTTLGSGDVCLKAKSNSVNG